ncbi:hypothetical protein D9758_005404 [Tetrapyrgos nigripes]|uniref:Uncharacterized protein n=1 Tax=Tetrapyrgos nigripes TaxID=182062 RepID=A0A8H5GI26_9AGAR|nr:hypothetical protein D9758_005404 [Tetrapyrgos nigripes]
MANGKPDALLEPLPSWRKAGGRQLATTSRTPASARADKIFNDPDSWGSGDGIEDLLLTPPFFYDNDDIYSGTFADTEQSFSAFLMRRKSAVKGRHDRSQNSLTIKPFENKFHLQKRPSSSSGSDTSSSSSTASSTVSSATSISDDMEPKRLPVKSKWESVRDDVPNSNQTISLSPILAENSKLQLDSITGRMSLFWQQQNILSAVQTPKNLEFELDSDGALTPWTATSDFWKGKMVLDRFEKSMEVKDDDEEAMTPLTRVSRPKHKRTRTPPSIGPLTISTTTTTTTTTTKTVLTIHSPILGTPASVTTIVSASATWSILELYGTSPTSPKRKKLPKVPKTSGPLITTFTPPSPQLVRRSSLPKSAITATFGFVDAQIFYEFLVVTLPPRLKTAPEVTKIPVPRAPLTISIPDPKQHQKPKSRNLKAVRPLPKLPRASSPPPPVPAIPNALAAPPSQRTSLTGANFTLPSSTSSSTLSSSTTTNTPESEPSEMKMKKLLRSASRSESKKSLAERPLTPSSKAGKPFDSENSKQPPVPSIPPLPSTAASAIQSQQSLQKETPPAPSHSRKESISTAAAPSKLPVPAPADGVSKDAAAVVSSTKSRPPELEPASLISVAPSSSSTLSTSTPSSSSLSVPGSKRMRSPSVSVIDTRRSSNAEPPTPRIMPPNKAKRQTSLQIPMWSIPFPDPATLAMRRNNRSGSVSTGSSPSNSPAPTPAANLLSRKPSFSSLRPNLGGMFSRTRKESGSGSATSGSPSQSDVSLTVPIASLEGSLTTSGAVPVPGMIRHRKQSSSSKLLNATAVTTKPDAEVVRRSPPSKLPVVAPEVGKAIHAGKTHSRTPSAVAAPTIPIPPLPADAISSPATKPKPESRPPSPMSLAASDAAASSLEGSLSRTPSRRKNSVTSTSIPQMNVPFPKAATLAKRATRKTSFSNLNRPLEPPIPNVAPSSLTETKPTVKKQASFTNSSLAFPPPAKSIKRVSSTPGLRSSSFDSADVPLPDTSALLKRMASKGATVKVRPAFDEKPVPVVPPVPSISPLPSTKDETPSVPIPPSQRPRAAPLPDIFYKPGTGKSNGKDKQTQKGIEGKEKENYGGREDKEAPQRLMEKGKAKQKELSLPLPKVSVSELNPRISRDLDEDFEKKLDKAIFAQSVPSTSVTSSLKLESEPKILPPLQLSAHKKAPSISLSKLAATPLPDVKEPVKKEQELFPVIPDWSKAEAANTTVSLKPVAGSAETARKRLSTVTPIITTDLKPKSVAPATAVPPLSVSKHSRSRSLSSSRIPVPHTSEQTPPVPSLPPFPSDLAKPKQSLVSNRNDDAQTLVIQPRRSRSPTRPTTPGGPRLRSKSVTSGTRVSIRSASLSGIMSPSSSELGLPLVPPPPLGKEEREGTPVRLLLDQEEGSHHSRQYRGRR